MPTSHARHADVSPAVGTTERVSPLRLIVAYWKFSRALLDVSPSGSYVDNLPSTSYRPWQTVA